MDIRAVLAQSAFFAALDPAALDALASCSQACELRSNHTLFREGDAADDLYLVATGRLRAIDAHGAAVGEIGVLEVLGEIGVLSGAPRTATVIAVRDSLLLKIGRAALLDLFERYPAALLTLARLTVARLVQNQRQVRLLRARSTRTVAVVPLLGDTTAREVAAGLLHHFATFASTSRLLDAEAVDRELGAGSALTHFTDGAANERLMAWLNELEGAHRYLIYGAGAAADSWARRCMRQADRVLLAVSTAAAARSTPMVETLRQLKVNAPVELVLVQGPDGDCGDPLGWRSLTGARAHHYLRAGNAGDAGALARRIAGRGLGLVLGGGGARGFAHIGLMRAFEELQLPVDVIGGSSMGALFSALRGYGYSSDDMLRIARETFVKRNFLNDYMFPRVALIRGRKFLRRMREIFGAMQIEHLATPYFCVTTNLTVGVPVVHEQGELALWVAASMAVPGIAPPVAYRGDLLADGAVINSLPTDILQAMERGPIVASDVSTEGVIRADGIEGPEPEALLHWIGPRNAPTLIDILFRTATLTSESGVARRAERADCYIRMPVSGFGMFEWKELPTIAERGYQYAMEKLVPVKSELLR